MTHGEETGKEGQGGEQGHEVRALSHTLAPHPGAAAQAAARLIKTC